MTANAFALFQERKFDELIQHIERGDIANLDEIGPSNGWTLLHHATERNLHTLMRELVRHGADVNSHDSEGHSPLSLAFYPETLRTLLELSADINHKGDYGHTPIFSQSATDDVDVFKIILDAGADINARLDDGSTPLMSFIRDNDTPVGALELIAAGADVNAVNTAGDTVLHIAASHTHFIEVVEELLKAGANPLAINSDGRTPGDVASDDEIQSVLQRAVLNAELEALIETASERVKREDGGI